MARIFSNGLILVGIVLLAEVGFGYFTQPPEGPALVVPQADVELTDVRAGKETEFMVPVDNHSRKPIKVVGLSWC
jgi:hypothetical protein